MAKKTKAPEAGFEFIGDDLTTRTIEWWKAGRPVSHIVSDEQAVCERKIKEAGQILSTEEKPVRVVVHDRWSGFRLGLPTIPPCKNKSNIFANALQMALMTDSEMDKHFPGVLQGDDRIPFRPADSCIIVFSNSCDEELKAQPGAVTLLRNIISATATGPGYVKDREAGSRGDRLIILLTTGLTLPESIPELKPEIVPLPGYRDLYKIAVDIFEEMFEEYDETGGEKGCKPFGDELLEPIANSMRGLSTQDAEETLALASVRHQVRDKHAITDLDAFLETIEDEKGKAIAKTPGLRYIPKRDIVDHQPAGYEALGEFIDGRMKISSEAARRYGIQPIRGIAIGGSPGLAKTEVAKYIARKRQTTALVASIGEFRGSLVGQSEANMRRAIQAGRAMHATMIWDDIDKSQLGSSGANVGDSGTSSNMNGMLLSDMTDPTSPLCHVATFNRVPGMPELLRPGRMDKLIFVERPNARTRLAIFKDHIARWKDLKIDDEELLESLAGSHTEGWTGAEIAHVLVKDEAIYCIANGLDTISVSRMIARAEKFTPMSKMKTFAADIAAMEEACSQFERMGNIPDEARTAPAEEKSRSRRSTR